MPQCSTSGLVTWFNPGANHPGNRKSLELFRRAATSEYVLAAATAAERDLSRLLCRLKAMMAALVLGHPGVEFDT